MQFLSEYGLAARSNIKTSSQTTNDSWVCQVGCCYRAAACPLQIFRRRKVIRIKSMSSCIFFCQFRQRVLWSVYEGLMRVGWVRVWWGTYPRISRVAYSNKRITRETSVIDHTAAPRSRLIIIDRYLTKVYRPWHHRSLITSHLRARRNGDNRLWMNVARAL